MIIAILAGAFVVSVAFLVLLASQAGRIEERLKNLVGETERAISARRRGVPAQGGQGKSGGATVSSEGGGSESGAGGGAKPPAKLGPNAVGDR